ncbi:MAG: phosphate signaling complex protein PhoU [Lentisphaeria bacterium]|nr:phosphate signaling complex protein PhoU [Lentisphaeria bacterium]
MHLENHLQRELNHLKIRLIELSAEVERSIEQSREALFNYNTEVAREIITHDDLIDRYEVDIEEECLKILALYRPVAADLRVVISILKINNDLERIADLASNIASYVISIDKGGQVVIPDKFTLIYKEVIEMVSAALDALVNADSDLAKEVLGRDSLVDLFNSEIIQELKKRMQNEPDNFDGLMFLISVSRNLERIGDYATNIAEDIFYLVSGDIIRHHVQEI